MTDGYALLEEAPQEEEQTLDCRQAAARCGARGAWHSWQAWRLLTVLLAIAGGCHALLTHWQRGAPELYRRAATAYHASPKVIVGVWPILATPGLQVLSGNANKSRAMAAPTGTTMVPWVTTADDRARVWNFNEKVGLTSACLTMAAAMVGAIVLGKSSKVEMQDCRKSLSAPGEAMNLDIARWMSVATCFCNINYACLLPSIVLNTKDHLIQLGALIGIYALGSVLTYPVFCRIPAVQAKWALLFHAACTIIGNFTMVVALCLDSTTALFCGRLICGMEAGVKYSTNLVLVELVGPKERLDAAMTNRLYTSVGIALGPAVGAFPRLILQAVMPAQVLTLMPTHWAEAVPLAIMGAYGVALTLWVLSCFRSDVRAPLDDSITDTASADQPETQEYRYAAKLLFSATIVTNFTRNFIKTLLEAGTLISLVHIYKFGDVGNIILFFVAASLFLGRRLTRSLNRLAQDDVLTLKILDRCMLCTCPFLFHVGCFHKSVSIATLVCACMVVYNLNCCQSGVLMTAASKVAIKDDAHLSKSAFTTYLYFSNAAAYFFGPFITFLAMHLATSQSLMAVMLFAAAGIQCAITNYALEFMARQTHQSTTNETVQARADVSGTRAAKLSDTDEALVTGMSTVSSLTSTPANESSSESEVEPDARSAKVAILKYQFGNYDFQGVDDLWALPKLANIDVSGFFFYSKGSVSDHDLLMMQSHGWMPRLTASHEGNQYVCADRLTAKRTKFVVPDELRQFDMVISHDCDVSVDYGTAVPYLLNKLREDNVTAILQHHFRRRSVLEEIDGFLNDRPWRVSTSRENCIKWRAEVAEMVASGKYKFDGEHYAHANFLVYQPSDPTWHKVGQKIYEKCHFIQRDQFMIPWAVQSEELKYSWTTREELTACGFRFRSKLRHLQTGVFN